jgi:hypothetical protein
MQVMDDTPTDRMLTELEDADPADAPPLADAIADTLSDALEAADRDEGDDSATEA